MVLLSCSGTGGDIYTKLANGVAQYNCAQVSTTHNSSAYDLLHAVNKRIIANSLIELRTSSTLPRRSRITGNPEVKSQSREQASALSSPFRPTLPRFRQRCSPTR
jgi:hypothetical protein